MSNLSGSVVATARDLATAQRVRQVDIARALGLSQAAVSDRMRGKTPFTLDELGPLADLLGVDPVDLVLGAGAEP